MDIEVVVEKYDGIGFLMYDCRSLRTVDKSVSYIWYYTEQGIISNIYSFRNCHLTGMEYHYTGEGMFDGFGNHWRRYVLSRDDDYKMRLFMNC